MQIEINLLQIFMAYKTIQRVFVPNLKLFRPINTELWAREVGDFSIMLHGEKDWKAFFCLPTRLPQYKCMKVS